MRPQWKLTKLLKQTLLTVIGFRIFNFSPERPLCSFILCRSSQFRDISSSQLPSTFYFAFSPSSSLHSSLLNKHRSRHSSTLQDLNLDSLLFILGNLRSHQGPSHIRPAVYTAFDACTLCIHVYATSLFIRHLSLWIPSFEYHLPSLTIHLSLDILAEWWTDRPNERICPWSHPCNITRYGTRADMTANFTVVHASSSRLVNVHWPNALFYTAHLNANNHTTLCW